MYGYVYITTNKINGKIYIGQHAVPKYEKYLGSGKLIKEAISKYGFENFENEVIEWCNTEEELNNREKYWIKYYKSLGNCYNMKIRGSSGKHSKESKKRMSEIKKGEKNAAYGKPKSKETKRKLSESVKGYKHTDEAKEKMSKKVTIIYKNKEYNFKSRKECETYFIENFNIKTYSWFRNKFVSEDYKNDVSLFKVGENTYVRGLK